MKMLSTFNPSDLGAICRRTMVIIPALNEAITLPGVLSDLKCWPLAGIRVVDNGSTDETVELAVRKGAEVIKEPVRGYGSACWRGIRNLPDPIAWILFCDADGCDDLWGLAPFFEAAAAGHDLVLGNRNSFRECRRSLTWPQRFGNALAGHLIGWRWGVHFQDLGPLRLIRRTSLELLDMEDRGFGWTVEMQAKAAAMHLKVKEIPVPYFPRKGGKSKISGTVSGTIKAGTVILGTLAKLWFRRSPYV
jgi:glycosyltransferase involved in cell wall biosynthesis